MCFEFYHGLADISKFYPPTHVKTPNTFWLPWFISLININVLLPSLCRYLCFLRTYHQRIWWRLLQKRVMRTELDILAFIELFLYCIVWKTYFLFARYSWLIIALWSLLISCHTVMDLLMLKTYRIYWIIIKSNSTSIRSSVSNIEDLLMSDIEMQLTT